jgi:putative SOS response-associated peptidase YedK
MCGRYARRSDKQKIAQLFAINGPVMPDFGPSWNVAPQTFQPIVRLNRDTRERELVLMGWGLIPSWILLANSRRVRQLTAMYGPPSDCKGKVGG